MIKDRCFMELVPKFLKKLKCFERNMTRHEIMLWDKLKSNQLLGLRFKSQHPIHSFIADFYCHKLKLVIEIDGETHISKVVGEYDNGREKEMEAFGIQTIRFTNKEIDEKLHFVIETIKVTCLQIAENSNLLFTPPLKGEADLNFETIRRLKGVGDEKYE